MVVVIGSLAKPLQVRSLPSGLSLACFDLHVLRSDQSVDTVPVALFGPGDQRPSWVVGQELLAIGRVRRRFFRTAGTAQSRTEVVAERVMALDQEPGVCSALTEVGATLSNLVEELRRASQSSSEPYTPTF